ncbi:TBC1 domain family member 20 [Trichinella britovi]|uniref:TBC1 domain family member 20 n=1 Tax=Trichinella britovi TaxID=45882 RepID=A0A0V1DA75_TRIBR|nr:TBC1 domain family member 20 [Trichinella britovi]
MLNNYNNLHLNYIYSYLVFSTIGRHHNFEEYFCCVSKMSDFMTLSSKEMEKLSIIKKCLNDRDISMLKKLAVSKGGLILNHCRRKGWLLLTCGVDALDENIESEERASLQKHKEYNQVYLDAIRTSSRFPSTMQKEQRGYYQQVLCRIIVNILIENPSFQYFQGFHDVCLTVLLAVSETHALAVCDHLAKTAFRSFLEKPLGNAIEKLELILKIVREIDVEVYEFFETHSSKAEFAVSWILTWYAHVIRDHEQLFRLYDYFLASDEHMPIYMAAAIVLWRRSEILNPQSDYGRVHQQLSTFPKHFPIEAVINDAQDLYESYPPIIFASAVNRMLFNINHYTSVFKPFMRLMFGASFGLYTSSIYCVFSANFRLQF